MDLESLKLLSEAAVLKEYSFATNADGKLKKDVGIQRCINYSSFSKKGEQVPPTVSDYWI